MKKLPPTAVSRLNRNNVAIIIQARMGATRLPNKMMLWLHGYPVIEWVFRRVNQARLARRVIFALPDNTSDNILAEYLTRLGAQVFRGSETDVVARYWGAARSCDAEQVVRVCADNPFISGSEIDRLIEFYNGGNYDYAYNHIPKGNSYPDGLGAEIVSKEVLARINREARNPEHREHVFNYIWANAAEFRVGTCDPLDASLAHPELKLDLDTLQDYQQLLQWPVRPDMSAAEIVAIARDHSKTTREPA